MQGDTHAKIHYYYIIDLSLKICLSFHGKEYTKYFRNFFI